MSMLLPGSTQMMCSICNAKSSMYNIMVDVEGETVSLFACRDCFDPDIPSVELG